MKRTKSILFLMLAVFTLTSCDKEKSAIKELTKQFVSAVNNNDVATIYDLYPDAKQLEHIKLRDTVDIADIEVEKEEQTGNYIASIKNLRDQKLVFKVTGKDSLQIADSYGFFELDSMYQDLALQTGVPLKKESDLKLKSLFAEDGDYISFIKDKYEGLTAIKLSSFDGVYYRYYSSVHVEQNIRNNGDFAVKGTDYNVIFHFNDAGGYAVSSTKVKEGVDLAPGETYTYRFTLEGYSSAAYYQTLSWNVSFKQKGGRSFNNLLKKAKFTGNEYSEFLKQEAEKQKKAIKKKEVKKTKK